MLPPLQFPLPPTHHLWRDADFHKHWQMMFESCLINVQEIGVTNEHLESEVTFNITRGDDFAGKDIRKFSCTVRHSLSDDTTYENAVLTTLTPIDLQGKVNAEQFRRVVEYYYRGVLKRAMPGISTNGVINLEIRNTLINSRMPGVIDVSKGYDGGAW